MDTACGPWTPVNGLACSQLEQKTKNCAPVLFIQWRITFQSKFWIKLTLNYYDNIDLGDSLIIQGLIFNIVYRLHLQGGHSIGNTCHKHVMVKKHNSPPSKASTGPHQKRLLTANTRQATTLAPPPHHKLLATGPNNFYSVKPCMYMALGLTRDTIE